MKTLPVLVITCILPLLFSCSYFSGNGKEFEKITQKILVDTIEIKDTLIESKNFQIEQSFYPQLKGLSDSTFLREINSYLKETTLSFIDSTETSFATEPVSDVEMAENFLAYTPASVICSFSIYHNPKNSIVSIIQYFWRHGLGTGTAHDEYFKITNIDVNKNVYFEVPTNDIKSLDSTMLNAQFIKYVKSFNTSSTLNPEDIMGMVCLPTLEKPDDFKKYGYLLKNDSICFVFVSNCATVYDGIYQVPLFPYHN